MNVNSLSALGSRRHEKPRRNLTNSRQLVPVQAQAAVTRYLWDFRRRARQARSCTRTDYYLKARFYFSSPFRESNLTGDPARTIYVQALSGQKLCLKVRPGDTVLSLKQKIRDSTNIPLERQRLIISGRQLVDGKRLYESNVFDGATMHVVLRLARGN